MSFATRLLYRKVPELLRRGLHPAKRAAAITAEIREARAADKNMPLIAVRIGGAIGDHIVIARFMRDLVASVENVQFDVYSGIPDHARWLFAGVKGYRSALLDARFDSVASEYDASLTLNDAAILHEEHARWSALRACPKLAEVCNNIVRYRTRIDTFVANQPLLTDALGGSTTDPIVEVDLNLINKTTLPQAAELLRHSILHLDIDGGLVHLASCFGVTSCVVFGPTPSRYVGYPGNLNIDPNFCGGCWWVSLTWMGTCPRGFTTARCMSEQDPRSVARVAERHLKQNTLPANPSESLLLTQRIES
jgi:hypothetical protein